MLERRHRQQDPDELGRSQRTDLPGWVTMKVVLLVAYIVLGSIALKRGRTKRIRVAALVAALLTIGWLVSVARAHHPLGFLARG